METNSSLKLKKKAVFKINPNMEFNSLEKAMKAEARSYTALTKYKNINE